LKIQLEEAKRTEEVMKSQMMKKEEEVENIEEEVVTLRVKVIKLRRTLKRQKNPHHQLKYQKERMKKSQRLMQK
jgi:hypothetical protein